jgi:mRNA interferase RelE/StbE
MPGYNLVKKVAYSKLAIKTLKRIPATESKKITAKINQYAANPGSLSNNVKKLQGVDAYRLRIGGWRVIFDDNDTVIAMIKIGPRGDVYKGAD